MSNNWPQLVTDSDFKPISTIPLGHRRQILLRNDKEWTSGLLAEDGSIIDGINIPGQSEIFKPTHWAHPFGLIIENVDGNGAITNESGEIIESKEK